MSIKNIILIQKQLYAAQNNCVQQRHSKTITQIGQHINVLQKEFDRSMFDCHVGEHKYYLFFAIVNAFTFHNYILIFKLEVQFLHNSAKQNNQKFKMATTAVTYHRQKIVCCANIAVHT